ncbi:hypothetical protein FHS29_007243 [Saccharothrix tamanrassetensis]|uniref:Major facilitator superfamily (MFS) profile domain-containing protein n=1 Tax=Saccharothrix tamanrassetensis TaxID=1051531 RepID=A0A841CXF2_9PSEU|nr:hypothetical protein [Saccharothrix tamanrassetensis]
MELFSWRAGFWATVPPAVVGIVTALLVVPESRAPRTARVDAPSVVLSAASLLALVWAIIESPGRGWTDTSVLAGYVVAAVLLTAFAARRARARHPMLPPALLRKPRVGMAALALAMMSFALYGALFVITLYLQGVLEYGPWEAGLRTLPLAVALTAGAGTALPLLSRHGEKPPILAGLGVVSAAFIALSTTDADSGYPHVLLFQLVAGFGAGLVATAGTETVMAATPADRAALGSAINDSTRQVGACLGVAVQGSILAAASTAHPPADASFPDVRTEAEHLPEPLRTRFLDDAREAFIDGMTSAATVAAIVTIAAAALIWRFLPHTARPLPRTPAHHDDSAC